MSTTWRKKGLWIKDENTFSVEVSHRVNPDGTYHSWNVYAYIGKKHPRFARFIGTYFSQAATDELPFHGGCTFCELQQFGRHSCYKVGSDYHHLGDHGFEIAESEDDEYAQEVFRDAQKLYDFLLAEQDAATPPLSDS